MIFWIGGISIYILGVWSLLQYNALRNGRSLIYEFFESPSLIFYPILLPISLVLMTGGDIYERVKSKENKLRKEKKF